MIGHHGLAVVAALAAALGVAWVAVLREFALTQEMLAGFGLGAIVGAVITVVQDHRGRAVNAVYTVNVAGLLGLVITLLLYIVTELA